VPNGGRNHRKDSLLLAINGLILLAIAATLLIFGYVSSGDAVPLIFGWTLLALSVFFFWFSFAVRRRMSSK
jgi:hypothetical protein